MVNHEEKSIFGCGEGEGRPADLDSFCPVEFSSVEYPNAIKSMKMQPHPSTKIHSNVRKSIPTFSDLFSYSF